MNARMFGPFWALVRKDVQIFVGDRRALAIILLLPVIMTWFFGRIFAGDDDEAGPARIAIAAVDLDGTEVSKSILAGLREDPNLSVRDLGRAEARELVARGKVSAVVVVPERFATAANAAFFRNGNPPTILLWADPSRAAEAGMVRGLLTQHVMKAVSADAFTNREQSLEQIKVITGLIDAGAIGGDEGASLRKLMGSLADWMGRPGADAAGGGDPAGFGFSIPFTTKKEDVTAQGGGIVYSSYAHTAAGMGVQFILFAAIEAGLGLLADRRGGIWRRLRAAPLSRSAVLGARWISGAIIALMVYAAVYAFAMLACGVRVQGSLAGFLLLLAMSSLWASSFSLLVAALGRTQAATRAMATMGVLLMVMLGGSWIPAFLFPGWLQDVTLILPTRWAVDGLDAMSWRGRGFDEALVPLGVLAGFTALFLLVAWWRFGWDRE